MPFYPFIDVESTHCSSDGGSRSSNGCHPFHTFLAVCAGRQCCSRYSTEEKKTTYLQNAQKSPAPGTKHGVSAAERANGFR